MKKMIENIGKTVIDFLYDFDNNDYALESGCCEPENGIYEAPYITIQGFVTVFGHNVTVNVNTKGKGCIEVMFEDDDYENLEDAVNEFVEEGLDKKDLYAEAIDHYNSNYEDEWQRNGFRDEADYNHWRYSA